MTKTLISWLDSLYGWLHPEPTRVPGDPHFQYWADDKRWYYALVSGNNELLVLSSQGYANKAAVLRAIEQCRRNAATAVVLGRDRAPTE
jgi:uncharacterized protein YegP (UPF0339 family)